MIPVDAKIAGRLMSFERGYALDKHVGLNELKKREC